MHMYGVAFVAMCNKSQ